MAATSASSVAGGRGASGRCCSRATRCTATWRARLDEHLGNYAVEPATLRAGEADGDAGRTLRRPGAWRRWCGSCPSATRTRRSMRRSPRWSISSTTRCSPAALIVRFELRMLEELGFGLDLEQLRRDRDERRPRLRLAEERAGGEPLGGRPLPRPDAAAAGLPARGRPACGRSRRGSSRRLPAHRLLPRPPRLRAARPAAARGAGAVRRAGCRRHVPPAL